MTEKSTAYRMSVVVPARNEAGAVGALVRDIRERYPEAELIVVDDGSQDNTGELAEQGGARVVRHPYGMGNGAAIKSGARVATGDLLVFLDGDGQHDPADIARLLSKLDEGFDMAVGARDRSSQASIGRGIANRVYNYFASWMVGQSIKDLTSGFRAARATRFREFLHLLPNGFSYPTTSTMAFFRSGYAVGYVPIKAHKRIGRSHIRIFNDGVRFLLIMFKIGALYSPLKIFFPISVAMALVGVSYYGYTFAMMHTFTNMSALLLTTSVVIFLIGLVSEQITMLLYQK